MKLAEALKERADLTVRLEQLCTRMTNNAQVQEGDKPAEAPAALMGEFDRCAGRLEELICRINLTNSATMVDGEPMTALLARRDILKKRVEAYRQLAERAGAVNFRVSRAEIKTVSTVDVAAVRKKADDLAREFRELDNRIQAANWASELK